MSRSRIATFNLLHGMSLRTGDADASLLADAAARLGADVVGLQEVDRHQPRSGGVDQTAIVAASLCLAHWRFEPALYGTPGLGAERWRPSTDADDRGAQVPAYGVGLASRWPVLEWAVRRFAAAPLGLPLLIPERPHPRLHRVPDEPRVALLAVIEGPEGPFTVATAHLSFVPGYNARQLRALGRWVRGFPGPRLLVGDFNLPGTLPSRLTGWPQLARVATYPSYRPRIQFDHVLSDGIDVGAGHDVRALALPVSDHCALIVDVAG